MHFLSTNIAVGEIWQVRLVDAQGHEQQGTRPVIVLAIHNQANLVMVTPCTGNLAAQRFPFSYKIVQSSTNGLSIDSVALVYQTRCLTRARFIGKLGNIGTSDFNRIKQLLRSFCGL